MTKALLVATLSAFVLAACGQDASKGAPKTGASSPTTAPATPSTPPSSTAPDAKKDATKK